MARARLVVAESDLADRREHVASDREDRHRAFRPVGDERERASAIDRHARRPFAGLQLRRDLGGRGLEVDHCELVVGDDLLRIGRIDLRRPRHECKALVARDRHARRRTDNAGRDGNLGDHFGRCSADIDDGDGVGWRIGRHRIDAINKNSFSVVGGERQLSARAACCRHQRGERNCAHQRHMAMHELLPLPGSLYMASTPSTRSPPIYQCGRPKAAGRGHPARDRGARYAITARPPPAAAAPWRCAPP